MKLQIVKTDKGYVAISDEKPYQKDTKTKDEGKWALSLFKSWIGQLSIEYGGKWRLKWKVSDSIGYLLTDPFSSDNYRMIVATDSSFKLEGIPQFELEKENLIGLAEAKYPYIDIIPTSDMSYIKAHNIKVDSRRIAFIQGYKAAQEKGCYSIEDMRKAISDTFRIVFKNSLLIQEDSKRIEYDIINSLNQPKKLVAIEVETAFKRPSEEAISDEMKTSGNINNLPLVQIPKLTKSEEHSDGLLTVQKYYYE